MAEFDVVDDRDLADALALVREGGLREEFRALGSVQSQAEFLLSAAAEVRRIRRTSGTGGAP